MVKDRMADAAQVQHLEIPKELGKFFMRMDERVFGPEAKKGETLKNYETLVFHDGKFCGNAYDTENDILAVVAYDPMKLGYSTFVSPKSARLISDLEDVGFRREPAVPVPNIKDTELFCYETDRNKVREIFKRFEELQSLGIGYSDNVDPRLLENS